MAMNFNANNLTKLLPRNNSNNSLLQINSIQNTIGRQMNTSGTSNEYGSFSFRKMFKPNFAHINAKNDSENKLNFSNYQSIKKIYDPCTSGSIAQVSGSFGIENTLKKSEYDKTLSAFQLTSNKPLDCKNLSQLASINDTSNNFNLNNNLFKTNLYDINEDKENVNTLNTGSDFTKKERCRYI